MDPKDIQKALVVGAGVMGHSIAQVFAQAGIETRLVDLDEKALQRALSNIKSNLSTLAEQGILSRDDIPLICDRIILSTDLAASAQDVPFAVEAVSETRDIKREIFSRLDEFCPKNTVIASNTSGLDVFQITDIENPERLVIAHWYAPAHIIPLVEVAPGPLTSPEVVSLTFDLMKFLGKQPVKMNTFVSGFIANRIQWAIARTVFEILENGWATPKEIDLAIKMSLGIRLPIVGVVQTMDFNGLDLIQNILAGLNMKSPLIDEQVSLGKLGVKSSQGLYDYGGRSEEEITKKRDMLFLQMVEHLTKMKVFQPI